MEDWIYDHLGRLLASAFALIFVLIGLLVYADYQEHKDQHCVATERQYVPPTYVNSGNVMIPVGGGMQDVCVRWEDN